MAIALQGVLGGFTGKVGPVTAYIRNGQNILRSSTSNVKYKYTALRTAQLHKIALCSQFTKAFTGTGFFSKSFPAYGTTGTGLNRATSALLNQAVAGMYPNMYLEYERVLVSKGKLPPPENVTASVNKQGIIHFSFDDNSFIGSASPDDKVILVAYEQTMQQSIFSLNAGQRQDGEAVLDAKLFKGNAVETWIGFLSSDELNTSDSVWTGRFEM